MKHGGRYTKQHPDATPELIERTQTAAEAQSVEKTTMEKIDDVFEQEFGSESDSEN